MDKVEVRFVTRSSGPKGQIQPGQRIRVSPSEARLLVDGGYAVYVDAPPVNHAAGGSAEAERTPGPDNADDEPEAPETEPAQAPKGKSRAKRPTD